MAGLTRRRLLLAAAAGASPAGFAGPPAADRTIPATGKADRRLEPLDRLMRAFLAETKAPGAALAVGRNGRLLYARGFGLADREARTLVQPDTPFRIASVSKPFTAVATLQLAEAKLLQLDRPALPQAGYGKPKVADKRWHDVTLRQLLQHTGGWDRVQSFDPIARPGTIAKELKLRPPLPPDAVIRYMFRQPLDFDPGTRHAYSNLGYLVLGRAVARAGGNEYEAVVRERVLAPAGAGRALLGRALPADRAPGETRYYDHANRTGPALFGPRQGKPVPLPDGAENFEGFEAHGGWVASAPDLVRFALAVADPAKGRLLSAESLAAMVAPPPVPHDAAVYYGCGWSVRPAPQGRHTWWHTGLISGTSTILVRRHDGFAWAALFNSDADPQGRQLAGLIDGRIHGAVDAVREWPSGTG